MKTVLPKAVLLTLTIIIASPNCCLADEGMWLFNQAPKELLKRKYNFELTEDWLARAQHASIRFNNGGSGSFVSPNGLVVTNHHIGAGTLQKLSTKEKNYYRDGFYAKTLDQELPCPDLELNVLDSIVDVTVIVNKAVTPDMPPTAAGQARAAAIAKIESDSKAQTGLRSNVIVLYQGGLFHLYRFKKYTDIRLVMAPEQGIAFFGGDTDNFEYPRYNLDVCFFRVYENGKPLQVKHYFPWSATGPKEGDLVFVSGNPGSTNRLETVDRLKHRRDITLPYLLNRLRHLEGLLLQFSAKGPEQARIAEKDLFPVANARKAYTGQYLSLLNPNILAKKIESENKLREEAFSRDPELKNTDPWERIAKAEKKLAKFEIEHALFEKGDAFFSNYFKIARHIVRLADELPKDNAKRLPEYRDAGLDSLKFQLYSPAPIYPELEKAKLAGTLAFMAENLGGEHPMVLKVLAGKSPEDRATELVDQTKIGSVAERKRLVEKGRLAIDRSQDPMIRLAFLVDGYSRKLRQRLGNEVGEPEQQAYSRIAKARFEIFGSAIPPDATFSLRLAFGVVRGYVEDGKVIPYTTRYEGLFERAAQQLYKPPFEIPDSWKKAKGSVDLSTPFNFVSTADTIGGNSGSPVLNRAGELVGINFDRNRHGLVRNYVYTDNKARHVSVHSQAVITALQSIYHCDRLVKELLPEN